MGSRNRLSKSKRLVFVTSFGAFILLIYRFLIAKYPELLNEHCRFVLIYFEHGIEIFPTLQPKSSNP